MHEVLVNRLGGLSLPRKSVVRLIDRPDMTLDGYCGRKTTIQQQQQQLYNLKYEIGKTRWFVSFNYLNVYLRTTTELHACKFGLRYPVPTQ